jgi:hypothetical protein
VASLENLPALIQTFNSYPFVFAIPMDRRSEISNNLLHLFLTAARYYVHTPHDDLPYSSATYRSLKLLHERAGAGSKHP